MLMNIKHFNTYHLTYIGLKYSDNVDNMNNEKNCTKIARIIYVYCNKLKNKNVCSVGTIMIF